MGGYFSIYILSEGCIFRTFVSYLFTHFKERISLIYDDRSKRKSRSNFSRI